jgi:hypothetical protein
MKHICVFCNEVINRINDDPELNLIWIELDLKGNTEPCHRICYEEAYNKARDFNEKML